MANGEEKRDGLAIWEETMKQAGHVPNYVPVIKQNIQQSNFSMKMPIASEDQKSVPEEPWGLQDWTPDNPEKRGPLGEDLPYGAKSWTAEGKPYYGTSNYLSEWAMGFWNNVYGKSNQSFKDWRASTGQAMLRAVTGDLEQARKDWEAGKEFKEDWFEFKEQQKAEGEKVKAVGGQGVGKTVSSFFGQALKGGLQAFNVVGEVAESVLGGLDEGFSEVAEMSSIEDEGFLDTEKLVEYWEDVDENLPKWAQKPAVFAANLLDTINVIDTAWDGIRAAEVLFDTSNQARKERGWAVMKDEFAAGRIAYSNWLNPALKGQFIERMNNGESAFLLQEELMNPWAEMAGQMILDPLNWVGGSALAKGHKTAVSSKTALKTLMTHASDEMIETIKGIEKVTDAKQVEGLIDTVQTTARTVFDRIDENAVDDSWKALTSNGKRAHITNVVGQFTHYLATSVKATLKNVPGADQIDEVMDILDHIILMSSDNADEVARAVDYLGSVAQKGIPGEVLFSDASFQTSRVLREMIGDGEDLTKLRKALAKMDNVDDVGEFLAKMDEKFGKAAEKLFPTLQQRAASGVELSAKARAIMRMENFANSKPMRFVNEFFANVYMGMSPGYAMRNMITNTLHIWADEGVGVFKNAKANPFDISNMERYVERFYGYIPSYAKEAMGQAGVKVDKLRPWNVGLVLGRKFEERASMRIFAASTKRTMNAMLKPGMAIPDIAPLVKAGMTESSAVHLSNLLIKTEGNVAEAAKLFRAEIATGTLSKFGAMGWLDNLTVKGLERYDLDGRFRDVINDLPPNATVEDAVNAMRDIFLEAEHMGKMVNGEMTGLPTDSLQIEDLEELVRHVADIDDDVVAVYTRAGTANYIAEQKLREFGEYLKKYATAAGLPENNVRAIFDSVDGRVLSDGYAKATQKTAKNFVNKVKGWESEIRTGKWKGNLQGAWKHFELPGNPPAKMTEQQLLDHIWDGYFRKRSRVYWAAVREDTGRRIGRVYKQINELLTNAGVNPQATDALADLGKSVRGSFENARSFLADARNYDSALVVNGKNIKGDWVKVNEWSDILDLARFNRIETAAESKAKTRHLYNIIKDNMPELVEQGKLTDEFVIKDILEGRISYDDVKMAISKHKGAGFNELTPTFVSTKRTMSGMADEFMEQAGKIVELASPQNPDLPPSMARGWFENKRDLKFLEQRLEKLIRNNFNDSEQTFANFQRFTREELFERSLTPEIEQRIVSELEQVNVPVRSGATLQPPPQAPDVRAIQKNMTRLDVDNAKDFAAKLNDMSLDEKQTLARAFGFELENVDGRSRNRVLRELGEKYFGGRGGSGLDDIIKNASRRVDDEGAKIEAALEEWIAEATRRTNHMRWTAQEIATEQRNFALIDYGERNNMDTMMSMVYPYGFWHSRTIPRWIKDRPFQRPGLIANYAKYRRNLEKIHAGQPDWWKYNLNTNDLPGVQVENPYFFNLEATLNPINGMTGVDFEDPYKITDTWTQTLNDMNRFGPSTHTIWSILTALNLKRQGQDDAAARWAGRLVPFTQTVRDASVLFGGEVTDYDPFVNVFSGGVDAYTARRAQRMLAQMQMEGMITEEQAIDTARSQTGMWWDTALKRAIAQRAPGQIASFVFGTGFKARTMTDLSIDQMYQDYYRILQMRDILNPDEFRIQMDKLHETYPMMNPVLVSDDSEYAYNVLARIPPGASSDFYKSVGLSRDIVDQFYQNKGDLSFMVEADRMRFMSAMLDLGALMAIPKDATKQEWTAARNMYTELSNMMKQQFGQEVQEGIDTYYGIFRKDKEAARQFLKMNPNVEAAMDFQAQMIAGNPTSLLATYYGGIEQINNFYKGQMYDEAEERFGEGIWQLQNSYYALPTSEREAFLRDYPALKEYREYRSEVQSQINTKVIELGSQLSSPTSGGFREDLTGLGVGASESLETLMQPADPNAARDPEEWINMIGEPAFDAAVDMIRGNPLSYRERQILEAAAEKAGLTDDELVQYIGISMTNP